MKFIFGVCIISVFFFTLGNCESVCFEQCADEIPKPVDVRIIDCDSSCNSTAADPKSKILEIDFKIHAEAKKLKLKMSTVRAKSILTEKVSNICSDLVNATCPVVKDQLVTYRQVNFKLLEKDLSEMKIKVKDDKDRAVVCLFSDCLKIQ